MPYKNKEDQKIAARRFYMANKNITKKRAVSFNKFARKRDRAYVDAYLKEHPCLDCGESDIIVLEFDHVRGKKSSPISTAIRHCWSIEKLQKEIEKCEVRCANCHRRVTHKRRKS